MTPHILGDNVPRKSSYDFVDRTLMEYFKRHPEEFGDKTLREYFGQLPEEAKVPPNPTDATKQSLGKCILMPRTATYALGLRALQEACIKENNPNHPQFTLPDNSKIYRPLTFKENIQARVENYETTHNPDGSERTLDERLSLITERWHDFCTAVAYKAGTTKFKIVPISPQLITLDPDFRETFLPVDYSTVNGTELDSSKRTYNTLMSQDSVLMNEGWLAVVEEDRSLLKSYTNIIFTKIKKIWDLTEGMSFWVCPNTTADELRSFSVDDLGNGSNAVGNSDLYYGVGSFLRRIPSLGASHKK